MKLRAGCRHYRNKQIPINAKVFKNKLDQECYLSGIIKKINFWQAEIYVFETDSFVKVPYDKIKTYLI